MPETDSPAQEKPFEPRIVAFMCNWCSYTASDLAGVSRIKYAPNVRIIRVMCSGRVDPTFVLKAFALGADGVMIAGCHPGDCHYVEQNYKTIRRHAMLKPMLRQMGVEQQRLQLVWVSAAECPRLAVVINEAVEQIRALGPLDWQSNWKEGEDRLEALESIVREHQEAIEV